MCTVIHAHTCTHHTQDSSYHLQQKKAVVLIKFLNQLYKTLPQFATFAKKVEFIEALVATLFVPSLSGGVGELESDAQVVDTDDWVSE